MSKQIQLARRSRRPRSRLEVSQKSTALESIPVTNEQLSELAGEVLHSYAEIAGHLVSALWVSDPSPDAKKTRDSVLESFEAEYRHAPAAILKKKRINLEKLFLDFIRPRKERLALNSRGELPMTDHEATPKGALAQIYEALSSENGLLLPNSNMGQPSLRGIGSSCIAFAQADIVARSLTLRADRIEVAQAFRLLDEYVVSLLRFFHDQLKDFLPYYEPSSTTPYDMWVFVSHMVHSYKRFAFRVVEYGRSKAEFEEDTKKEFRELKELLLKIGNSPKRRSPDEGRVQRPASKIHRIEVIKKAIIANKKGEEYAAFLDFFKANIAPSWIAEGCPSTNIKAYHCPDKNFQFRQRLQDEKTKEAGRMKVKNSPTRRSE